MEYWIVLSGTKEITFCKIRSVTKKSRRFKIVLTKYRLLTVPIHTPINPHSLSIHPYKSISLTFQNELVPVFVWASVSSNTYKCQFVWYKLYRELLWSNWWSVAVFNLNVFIIKLFMGLWFAFKLSFIGATVKLLNIYLQTTR